MRGLVFFCLIGCSLANDAVYAWNGPGEPSEPYSGTENICLSDPESCSCCLMQKQMQRLESFFNTSLNEIRKSLEKAQIALNYVRSSRSAFSVALTDSRRCLSSSRDEMVVKYQYIYINLGDGYNVSTGTFTVPRSGVYSLALTVYSDAGAPGALLAACVRLRKNGSVVAGLNEYNTQDQEDSATIVLPIQMHTGDKVDVTLLSGCTLCDDNSHYNTFSGFLLYATD